MSHGGSSYGAIPHGDGATPLGLVSLAAISTTEWEVLDEAGLRGGYVVEVEGTWDLDRSYTVEFFLLGTTTAGYGLPGNGAVCYARTQGLVPCVTPPLTPGLWRIRLTDTLDGNAIVPQKVLRAIKDDLPWHTYDLRRRSPGGVYRAMGPRSARDEY